MAVPAASAPDVMTQLGRAGTRAAVVFTSGFAEVAGGAALQQTLAANARAHGVQLLGPNCLGAMNLRARMFATFSPIPLTGVPPVGEVGLVSQSGAFGAYAFALAREAGLGLSHWVTTGNEAGVQVADVIEWLAHDPDTRVILTYMEGARDGARLRRALAAARDAGKPVVMTKVGTTAAGASAAQSHTASLAGEDAVYQAVFDEYGVHRARRSKPSSALGYTLARGRRPARWHARGGLPADAVAPVAIVTVSGGVGIMMADSAESLGLPLPPMPDAAAHALRTAIPFASTTNPIDVTGQVVAQPKVFLDALAGVARCGEYGSVAAFLAGGANAPAPVDRIAADRGDTGHGAGVRPAAGIGRDGRREARLARIARMSGVPRTGSHDGSRGRARESGGHGSVGQRPAEARARPLPSPRRIFPSTPPRCRKPRRWRGWLKPACPWRRTA